MRSVQKTVLWLGVVSLTLATSVLAVDGNAAKEARASVRHDGASGPDEARAFGDIVLTLDTPALSTAGLGWDGTNLWAVSQNTQTIYEVDPTTGAILDSFPAPSANFTFGLTHDGTSLWGDTDGPDEIYEADPVTGAVLTVLASTFVEPNGMAWDGSALWTSGFNDDLKRIDPTTGAILSTIPAPGNGWVRDLAWDGSTLWVVHANFDATDSIYQLDPSTGAVLANFIPSGATLSFMFGLTFDGQYLWLSDYVEHKLHKIDVGLATPSPVLAVSGSCPGPVTLDVSGATPSAPVAIGWAFSLGSFTIPSGSCAGTTVDLASPSLLTTLTADAAGNATFTATAPAAACGVFLQAVDLVSCAKSNTANVP